MPLSEQELEDLAGAPILTRTDEGTVRERKADEVVQLDSYERGHNLQAVPWGLKIAKTKPPSALTALLVAVVLSLLLASIGCSGPQASAQPAPVAGPLVLTAAGPTPVDTARVADLNLDPKGYQQLTSLATAQGLTVPEKAVLALVQIEGTRPVRWRDDGTDPTASVGIQVSGNTSFWYVGDLQSVKFIEENAGVIVNVSYYGFN
jgi:hypothetical protein